MNESKTLKRELGLLDVFSLAAGAMVSSGLFILPGLAFAKAGPAIILAYLGAALLMLPTLLAKAELATAMPKSGGNYFFIERSMGPLMGTVAGLLSWLSLALKTAFALVGIGALSLLLFPGANEWKIKGIAIIAALLFWGINLLGTKSVGRFQVVLVFGLLAILALYIFRGFGFIAPERYSPFLPTGWTSTFAVMGMVFISFGGLTHVASIAGEVRHPGRNLPLGMFLAFVLVSLLYVLVVFITVGTIAPEQLAGSLVPISLGAEQTMGVTGRIFIAFGALFAFATTANAGLMAASRSPMAMSRDGLVPAILSRTSARFNTPHISLGATATFIVLIIACLPLEELIKTASTMMILLFALVNVAVLVLRHSGIEGYRPKFRVPFQSWLSLFAIIIYGFLLVEMGRVPLLLTGGFALLASLWYLGYVQPRIDRQSAIVHLVTGITASAVRRTGIEDELRQISLERDQVVFDRFDQLVQDGVILDIDQAITASDLFQRLAATLAPRLQIAEKQLYAQFLERERESSTVIEPGLAIPHIITKGAKDFDLILVRCRPGITFFELSEPVKTVFALIGQPNQRNYHLRALMVIAHIVQEPGFRDRWLNARNIEQLRDVILLSSRQRETSKK